MKINYEPYEWTELQADHAISSPQDEYIDSDANGKFGVFVYDCDKHKECYPSIKFQLCGINGCEQDPERHDRDCPEPVQDKEAILTGKLTEAIEVLSEWLIRAKKSKRLRTEVRSGDLENLLKILMDQVDEPVQEIKEIYKGNACRFSFLCEEEVKTPIYRKAGSNWVKFSDLPYDPKYKTLSRLYCQKHLDSEFDTPGQIPKIITDNIMHVFRAGTEAMDELGFFEYIPLEVYHIDNVWDNKTVVLEQQYTQPKIVVSHRGTQQENGQHGHFTPLNNRITLFVKKSNKYAGLYQTYIHEMAHYFTQHLVKSKSKEGSKLTWHSKEFKAVLEVMTTKLGFEYEEDVNQTYVAEMTKIKS